MNSPLNNKDQYDKLDKLEESLMNFTNKGFPSNIFEDDDLEDNVLPTHYLEGLDIKAIFINNSDIKWKLIKDHLTFSPYQFKIGEHNTVKTLRNFEEINEALVAKKQTLIVRDIAPNYRIRQQYAVFQNIEDGSIEFAYDFREQPARNQKMVLDFNVCYPMQHPSPIAAYLLPEGAKEGDIFYIEDLIEEIVDKTQQMGASKIREAYGWYTEECLVLLLDRDINDKSPIPHVVG